ncbi:UNVERIFIED_CONTAM: Pentatricopeptide repeat-containing protein, mitochondrial [Sesamum calycinum]|uniref:Pentatricopeptide repeat-containing protein, mitochondrial n=1 Tax=Sesamum calycinum TaxID=2727403 RepID=A0AAW2RAD7_9LAMI
MSAIFNLSKLLTRRTNQKLPLFSHTHSRFTSTTSVLLPTHQQIAHLILDQKSAKEALQTFEWASKIPNFTHTLSTYRALIHKLCTLRQFEVVEQLLDEMPKKIGSSPDDDIFITVVRGFGRARKTRDVIRVLDLVAKFGKGAPSLKLLNTILDVLVKEDIDIAREFYRKKMMGNGLKGDDYTYGILMKGFCLTNRIGDGFKLLQVMKTHGVKALVLMEKCFSSGFVPDVVTLTKVIEILCNAGRISEGVEGFVKAGKVKAGSGFLKQMEIKGCLPNTDTYNVLIAGFCDSGMLDSALDMFDEMKRVGVRWNFVTFETLIHGFCSTGRIRDGFKIFELMVEGKGGCAGRIGSYNSILYGLYKENCLDEALEF